MPIPTQERPPDPFVLFVRAREGHIVRRFGTNQQIGYTYKPAVGSPPALDQRGRVLAPGKVALPHEHLWDTETIHAITSDDYDMFRKEYDAELVEDGGLVRVTREAWEKQRESRAEAASAKVGSMADAKQPAAPAGSEA